MIRSDPSAADPALTYSRLLHEHLPDLRQGRTTPASAADLLNLARSRGLSAETTARLLDAFTTAQTTSLAKALGAQPSTVKAGAALERLARGRPDQGGNVPPHPSLFSRLLADEVRRPDAETDAFARMSAALARGERLLSRLLDGPPPRPGLVPHSVKPLPVVKPVDWLRSAGMPEVLADDPAVSLHKRFVERNRFETFNRRGFSALEASLEKAIAYYTTQPTLDILRFELATVLMQNVPSRARLERAAGLLDALESGATHLPAEFAAAAPSVRQTIAAMLAQPEGDGARLVQANWKVNNRCPIVCKGCYNVFQEEPLSLRDSFRGLDALVAAGVQELVVSGGDPIVWRNLVAFVTYAHDKGLKVAVDTTGYTMTPELAAALAGKVTYVGIPVDGHTPEVVKGFRKGKADLLERSLAAARMLADVGVPVKINTVVHAGNVGHLNDIAALITEKLGQKALWGWSVFEWWDLRATDELRREMAVDPKVYGEAVEQLRGAHGELPIYAGSTGRRALSYFMVAENGEVYTFGKDAHAGTIILGSLTETPVADLIASPALDKLDNPKLQQWF